MSSVPEKRYTVISHVFGVIYQSFSCCSLCDSHQCSHLDKVRGCHACCCQVILSTVVWNLIIGGEKGEKWKWGDDRSGRRDGREDEWKKGGERRGDGSGKREGIGEEGGKGNYWE